MPLTNINYDNSCFYKIVCNDLEIQDLYVGHTTDFRRRKNEHKCACTNSNHHNHTYRLYDTIRDNGGWENWSMILIQKHKCTDSLEACKKERAYIEELKATLNSSIPSRLPKESNKVSQAKHRESIKKNQQQYEIDNHDKILLRKQLYRAAHPDKFSAKTECECGGCYQKSNKARHLATKRHKVYLDALIIE